MTGLVASQFLLWTAVLAQTFVIIALARQIGVLHERIAPVGALKVDQGVVIGDRAPRMTLPTLNGGPVRIGEPLAAGAAQLLLFVSPDCPLCKRLIPLAKSFVRDERLNVLYVSDGEEAPMHAMIEQHGLRGIPFARSPELGMRFGIAKLPYAVLIDAAGKVVSAGLVNSREHLESLVVAQQMGVPSVQAYLRRTEVPEGPARGPAPDPTPDCRHAF